MQSNLNKYISKNSKHAFSPQAGISTWHPCGIYEPSQNKSMESDPIDFVADFQSFAKQINDYINQN